MASKLANDVFAVAKAVSTFVTTGIAMVAMAPHLLPIPDAWRYAIAAAAPGANFIAVYLTKNRDAIEAGVDKGVEIVGDVKAGDLSEALRDLEALEVQAKTLLDLYKDVPDLTPVEVIQPDAELEELAKTL